jgi:hypothetical protein
MSKKIEKLKEMNILINNVLSNLETKIFIENDNNTSAKLEENQVESLY